MSDDVLIDVSRETMVLLKQLRTLVEKWNKSKKLISKRNLPDMCNRHSKDSPQIYYARKKSV